MEPTTSCDPFLLIEKMQGLSIAEQTPKSEKYTLDWPQDERLQRIVRIVEEFVKQPHNYMVANYLWEPALDIAVHFRPYSVERMLLTEDCPINYASYEHMAGLHLQANPPRHYFIARLIDTQEGNCICDAASLVTHLGNSPTNPLTRQGAEKIHFFITKGPPLFILFKTYRVGDEKEISTHIANHILANSLEESSDAQNARLILCRNPNISDEDFLHLMRLLLAEDPESAEGINLLKGYIARCNQDKKQNLSQAHSILGKALRQQEKWKDAETHLRCALALNEQNSFAHSELGNLLNLRDNLKQAELHLRRALELDKNNASAHAELGDVLRQYGKWKEAEFHLKRTLELNNKHAYVQEMLKDVQKKIRIENYLQK